jgi:hypothetical protein
MVTVAVPCLPPDEAVTVTISVGAAAVTFITPALVIGALVGSEDVHETPVRAVVLPSVRVPVAVKVTDPPGVTVELPLTVIDCNGALSTVAVVVPLTEPEVAVMVAVPAATPVRSPELLTVAVESLELDHVTLLIVAVLPSSLTPVADNCVVALTATLGEDGVMLMEVRTGLVKNPLQPTTINRANDTTSREAVRTVVRRGSISVLNEDSSRPVQADASIAGR